MAGSPTYTADTDLSSTYGTNETITGNISIANSGTTITGSGTKFNTELVIGDQITFIDNAGSTITKIVESISSDTVLEISAAVGGSGVATSKVATRNRTAINSPDKNTAIFKANTNSQPMLRLTRHLLGVVQNVRTCILVDFIPGTRPVLAASF